MKTEPIVVTSKGIGADAALALTEKLGAGAGLDQRSVLQLRLLAEELFGLLRGIAGDVQAQYRIEVNGTAFELGMKADVEMTDAMREQFLASSSNGKNAAAAGIIGKIRVLIADILLSANESLPYAMINTVAAYPLGGNAGEASSVWTMTEYRNEVKKNVGTSEEASEAWDELERSVIANIADEVKVSVAGKHVEITVYKTF